MEATKEKYQKALEEAERNIPMLMQLIKNPFEKAGELEQLKQEVAKLEREIGIRIQKNQLAQAAAPEEKMAPKPAKTLLPKYVAGDRKSKGLRA